MRPSLKFGVFGTATLLVGGLLLQILPQQAAYAQTSAQQRAQSATTAPAPRRAADSSAIVTPEMQARRVARRVSSWPTSAQELQNLPGGGGRPGGGRLGQTGNTVGPVPLTAEECRGLGGVVETFASGRRSCNVRTANGSFWMNIDQ